MLLLDEPTSALDPEATAAAEKLLTQRAAIWITHSDQQEKRVATQSVRRRAAAATPLPPSHGGAPQTRDVDGAIRDRSSSRPRSEPCPSTLYIRPYTVMHTAQSGPLRGLGRGFRRRGLGEATGQARSPGHF